MKLTARPAYISIFFSLFIASLLLGSVRSFCQQVDGHWYGVGLVQASNDHHNYMSELVLRQKGKTVSGMINYYFKDSLVKTKITGTFDDQTRRLRIKPFAMIYYLSPNAKNSIDVMMSGEFTMVASKTESVLNGSLVSDAEHRRTTPDIIYHLQRSNDTADVVMKDEPEEIKPAIAAAPVITQQTTDETAQAFTKRSKVFTKEIEVTGSSLRLEIYDNGEIDGDVVSLFLNNKKILSNSGLTHKAIRINIQLDPTLEYNELSMFAENLGRVPPNTAALIIYDGAMRYETLLTSDLSKNATIKLVQKK